MKQLVCSRESSAGPLLDYSRQTPFLDPSLFSFFSCPHPQVTLDQVLYAGLDDPSKLPRFDAWADHDGRVALAGLGTLRVQERDCVVSVSTEQISDRLQRADYCTGTRIEVCDATDPLLVTLLPALAWSDTRRKRQLTVLARAVTVLGETAPLLLESLKLVTRRIVTFSPDDETGSFAVLSAHGAAFLGATDEATEVFFIEDLSHQCGHILFNAVSVDREEFFNVPANTVLPRADGTEDRRDVYTALHGVFTEALMCLALHACLVRGAFSGQKEHELRGRLGFVVQRFRRDLHHLSRATVLSKPGVLVLEECVQVFNEVVDDLGSGVFELDMTTQSYAFDFRRFAASNPE